MGAFPASPWKVIHYALISCITAEPIHYGRVFCITVVFHVSLIFLDVAFLAVVAPPPGRLPAYAFFVVFFHLDTSNLVLISTSLLLKVKVIHELFIKQQKTSAVCPIAPTQSINPTLPECVTYQ